MATNSLILTLVYLSLSSAFQLFPSDSVTTYPTACGAVLSQNITACNNLVAAFDPYNSYDEASLEQSCNQTCSTALSNWYNQASSACAGTTFDTDEGFEEPIADVIGNIWFNFNQSCLMDGAQYCNIVLGTELADDNSTASGSSSNPPCNKCNALRLLGTAQSPYDDGPLVFSESLYQSYTSSCGGSLTNLPITTSVAPPTPVSGNVSATGSVPLSNSASPTGSACTGLTYPIKAGDSCNSVASSEGTATWWLLLDNQLAASCVNFPTTGALCINNPCTTYVVKMGDTCQSVANANNITVTQLQTWNPWIDTSCYNFNSTIGTSICVGQPGTTKYQGPTGVVGAPTSAISAVPVPTDIAPNTTTTCGQYYYVLAGESCDIVSVRFGISLSDFYILNPEIDANCTNLWANTSYCVQPVGSINDYPGSPFYDIGNSSNANAPAFSSFPNATYVPIFSTRTAGIAPGTPTDCYTYAVGSDLIFGYPDNSDCNAAAFIYGIQVSDLQAWNPSLDTNSTGCTFDEGNSYCMLLNGPLYNVTVTDVPVVNASTISSTASATVPLTSSTQASTISASQTSSTTAAIPSPTQSGSIARNCASYAKAVSGDYCSLFASEHSISTADLYNWNSALGFNGANCATAMQLGVYYCTSVTVPSPIQDKSIVANCDLYAQAVSGDYCYLFAQEHNITTDQLYAWNSVLGANGANCGTAMQLGVYYCIGTNGAQASTG